ncbi:hypothetical protein HMSSN139_36380 [Paenibacillus sp. HMSSN-139]|nr:hypothetical protein HMSSN139_36380 [Paenibacillus sp. HMSSN-139]
MNKKKILIIDDESAIADLLAYGLSKEGFYTRTAGNGMEGLGAYGEVPAGSSPAGLDAAGSKRAGYLQESDGNP